MQTKKTDKLQRHPLRVCACWLSAGLLVAAVVVPAAAQQGDMPPWLSIAIVRVEGGQAADFEDLLKDMIEARQARGLFGGQVFHVALGHPNEYHYVLPTTSIAEAETAPPPMSESEAVLWQDRITETVSSVYFHYAATFPEHGVEAPANAPETTLGLLRMVYVAQGKEAEYEEWVAEQYMPAFEQSGPLGHTMSHVVYGDTTRLYYHFYPIAGWEDLEGPDPLIEILGQRRYDQMFDAIDDVVVDHEMRVLRLRTDLMGQ